MLTINKSASSHTTNLTSNSCQGVMHKSTFITNYKADDATANKLEINSLPRLLLGACTFQSDRRILIYTVKSYQMHMIVCHHLPQHSRNLWRAQ